MKSWKLLAVLLVLVVGLLGINQFRRRAGVMFRYGPGEGTQGMAQAPSTASAGTLPCVLPCVLE